MSLAGVATHPEVAALVAARCSVCGGSDRRVVASAAELDLQCRYLRLFHRRRLRSGSNRDWLEERADFTHHYATNIVACRSCGLLARDPRPPDDAITEAYARDRYGRERLDALFDAQLEFHRSKIRMLQRFVTPRQPVVLEIGSFVGGFLAAGAELGWCVTGIDPGHEVADYCQARGFVVLRESVDACEFPAQAADCVAIWNTFDQLPDPHPTLVSAQRCLRPGGVLAIRVPAGDCFDACMQRLRRVVLPLRNPLLAAMAWNNLLSFPYLHGYSLPTLDRLLGDYGFRRIHGQGDVLVRLADWQTRPWAACEERVLKGLWKTAIRAAEWMRMPSGAQAPWIDAVYRSAAK